ncbi:MAG TPA: YciI family protein [Micromonosporaceae bacterium]|nr:YciI family protein [Micromonosporaceae bacterium]
MKYLLLIYNNPSMWDTLPAEDRDAIFNEVDSLVRELTESGEWVSGEALASTGTQTVQVRDGVPAVTDGPYAEAKEHLAGLCVVDCATPERAAEIAGRWPDARFGAMVVHPILDSA